MFTPPKNYLPLLIAVGPSGCYKADLSGYEKPFDTFRKYRLYIKHVPYKVFPQIKEIVTQDWSDEHGEDVWLPPSGVVNKAYDLDTEFIYFADDGMATQRIRAFCNEIKGKWLQIYDTYSQMGRRGVYVSEFDGDPAFKRRRIPVGDGSGNVVYRDYVAFKVKFRVNDPNTDIVLSA